MASLMIFLSTDEPPLQKINGEYAKEINIFSGDFPEKCRELIENIVEDKGRYFEILFAPPKSKFNFSRVTLPSILIDAVENLGESKNLDIFFQKMVDNFVHAGESMKTFEERENFLVELFIKIRSINIALDFAHYTYNSNVEFKGPEYWRTVEKINEIYFYLVDNNVPMGSKDLFIDRGMKTSEYLYMDYSIRCYLQQKYNYSESAAYEYSLNYCSTFKDNLRCGTIEGGERYLVDIFHSIDDNLKGGEEKPLAWSMLL